MAHLNNGLTDKEDLEAAILRRKIVSDSDFIRRLSYGRRRIPRGLRHRTVRMEVRLEKLLAKRRKALYGESYSYT